MEKHLVHFTESPCGVGKTTCCFAIAKCVKSMFTFKIVMVFPNKHLAGEARRELAQDLAPD